MQHQNQPIIPLRNQYGLMDKFAEYLTALKAELELQKKGKSKFSPDDLPFLRDRPVNFTDTLEIAIYKIIGFCWGLSLIRGAMDLPQIKKAAWWEAARDALLDWDGELESLNNEIYLSQSNDNQPVALWRHFENLFDFVMLQQTYLGSHMNFFNMPSQFHFVEPNGLFYILSPDNKKIVIEEVYTIVGKFDDEDLVKLLDTEQLKNAFEFSGSICLINMPNHTFNLTYNDGHWIFYDPDYNPDDKKKGTDQIFKNVNDLASMINKKADKIVTTRLLCTKKLEEYPFPFYTKCLEDPVLLHKIIAPDAETWLRTLYLHPQIIPQIKKTLNGLPDVLAAMIDYQFNDGTSLLIDKVKSGFVEEAKVLLESNANPELQDNKGFTALEYAIILNKLEFFDLLINYQPHLITSVFNEPKVLNANFAKYHPNRIDPDSLFMRGFFESSLSVSSLSEEKSSSVFSDEKMSELSAERSERSNEKMSESSEKSAKLSNEKTSENSTERSSERSSELSDFESNEIKFHTLLDIAVYYGHENIMQRLLAIMSDAESLSKEKLQSAILIAKHMNHDFLKIIKPLEDSLVEFEQKEKEKLPSTLYPNLPEPNPSVVALPFLVLPNPVAHSTFFSGAEQEKTPQQNFQPHRKF